MAHTSDAQPDLAQQQQAASQRRDHALLKTAFADTYIELLVTRRQRDQISTLLQEAERVIAGLRQSLPEEPPAAATPAVDERPSNPLDND